MFDRSGVRGSGVRGGGVCGSGVRGGTLTRTVVTVTHHGPYRGALPHYLGTHPPPPGMLVYPATCLPVRQWFTRLLLVTMTDTAKLLIS